MAQHHHRINIENVVNSCLEQANIDLSRIDAIAVTNRPGKILKNKIYNKF